MYISQKQAKLKLRKEAGFTVAAAEDEVRRLPKRKFNKREKVKLADVLKIVSEANQPTPISKGAPKIRPLNKKHVEQIRRFYDLKTER